MEIRIHSGQWELEIHLKKKKDSGGPKYYDALYPFCLALAVEFSLLIFTS